jgi:UDP-galactopyranose mutase
MDKLQYDYLIVGAGWYGAICAFELTKKGYKCLVVDKRDHIGGNSFTEEEDGVIVHKYGAHIFHTNDKYIWDYVNQFVEFNNFVNSPLAYANGKLYNLPFNMNTFYQLWGIKRPSDVLKKIQLDCVGIKRPSNLEEQAISLVGREVYDLFIKGYTEKQWGIECSQLPPDIIKRLPVRLTYDNNYFRDRYQGIPIGGYTKIFEKLLNGCEVRLSTDYFEFIKDNDEIAKKTIYTGPVDKYFGYKFGRLDYRSLRFENETLNESNFQGNAVINYTTHEESYTRIIEHKHFAQDASSPKTVITREYPAKYTSENEPYYPINDLSNMSLYKKYKVLCKDERNVFFGGRLAEYRYYDMHQVIASALKFINNETA